MSGASFLKSLKTINNTLQSPSSLNSFAGKQLVAGETVHGGLSVRMWLVIFSIIFLLIGVCLYIQSNQDCATSSTSADCVNHRNAGLAFIIVPIIIIVVIIILHFVSHAKTA